METTAVKNLVMLPENARFAGRFLLGGNGGIRTGLRPC